MGTVINCPHCGHKHAINLGTLVATARWKGTSAEERASVMRKVTQARLDKKKQSKPNK